jgi:hypothetical protein
MQVHWLPHFEAQGVPSPGGQEAQQAQGGSAQEGGEEEEITPQLQLRVDSWCRCWPS